MIRCPTCGTLNKWSSTALVNCPSCGGFIVMPAEAAAREQGRFEEGYIPPYIWEISQEEAVLILDALDALMTVFRDTLASGNMDEVSRGGFTESFIFTRMTRQRLRKLAPDLHSQVEA